MEGLPPGSTLLRPMAREDVPAVLALAQAEGRNVTRAEYERVLDLEGGRGFVVVRDGKLLGAATAMRYFEHGFLGPLLLREGPDPIGIGVALLAQLVEALQRDGIGVLDAEAAGLEEPILHRMGFRTVRRTLVLERPAGEAAVSSGPRLLGAVLRNDAEAPPADVAVPMAPHHLLDVGILDAAAAGYGRKDYLDALRREFPEGARVVEAEGEVSGFVLVRQGSRGVHLGPLVTRDEDAETARALVRAAVAAAPGASVVALVPESARAAELLASEGFREVGALARMRAGTAEPDPAGATQWAIGGRITG